MPVFSKHPEYQRMEDIYIRMRDAYNGEDAVKVRGEKYLPRLADDTDDEYASYKLRANFFPALARTVDGLVGGVFRVDPVFTFPVDEWMQDVTLGGADLKQFVKLMTTEVCLQGKAGILVDYDEEFQRPFLIPYAAESIINWSDIDVTLVEIVVLPHPDDPFMTREVKRYRHIIKTTEGAEVRTYNTSLDGTVETGYISTFIKDPSGKGNFPFIWLSPVDDTWSRTRPPLLGLANVNMSCYRNSADLENGRHITALPTPWIADSEIKQDVKNDPSMKIKLGSKSAFILSQGGHCGFMEFKGDGLGALERAIEEKKSEMAALGAMMILNQRKQVESSETARIHASGQTSILANVVTGAEHGIKKALELMAKLGNRTYKADFEMNRDFVETALDPTQLTALVQTWQVGGITHEILAWNLKKSSMIPPEMTVEEVVAAAVEELKKKQEEAMKQAQDMLAMQPDVVKGPEGSAGKPQDMKPNPSQPGKVDRRKMDKNTVGPTPSLKK